MDGLPLLSHLHRGGQFGYFWKLAGQKSRYYTVGTLKQLPPGDDIYWGVHPVNVNRPTDKRGRITDVAAVNCLFSEFDTKDFGSRDAINEHLESKCMLWPTAVINSGGGLHCYWLLDNPCVVTDENREQIRKLQYRFVIAIGGDQGAKDLARVLRVPGTLNAKYVPARTVELVEFWDNAIYSLDELQEWTEIMHPADVVLSDVAIETPARASRMRVADAIPHTGVAGILTHLAKQGEGNRNSTTYWAARRLLDENVPIHDAEKLMLPITNAIGLPDTEATRTIQSAYGGAA